jgi:acetyl-CoA carboxylase carboxyl transferase subunit beta
MDANWRICPKCRHHFRLRATQRLELLLGSRLVEHDAALATNDPLKFADTHHYAARLKETRRKLGKGDAIITAEGLLGGRPIICCSMEFAPIINPILATFHQE